MTLGQRGWIAALCAGALMAASSNAMAEEFSSQYTSAEVKKCRPLPQREQYDGSWACRGAGGHVVMIAEHDLRQIVSVGKTVQAAQAEPAAGQTFFPSFNSTQKTIEWRSRKGAKQPFAMIHRVGIWSGEDEDTGADGKLPPAHGLLVVTRLPPGPVCHVAYVDVAANPDANALARQAADESAGDFTCDKDKVRIVGQRGRAIELAGARARRQ